MEKFRHIFFLEILLLLFNILVFLTIISNFWIKNKIINYYSEFNYLFKCTIIRMKRIMMINCRNSVVFIFLKN